MTARAMNKWLWILCREHEWKVWMPACSDKPKIKEGRMPIQLFVWVCMCPKLWMECSHSLS
jgi:hypothetical protein